MAQRIQSLVPVAVQEEEHKQHDDELSHQADGAGKQVAGLARETLADGRELGLQVQVRLRPVESTAHQRRKMDDAAPLRQSTAGLPPVNDGDYLADQIGDQQAQGYYDQ